MNMIWVAIATMLLSGCLPTTKSITTDAHQYKVEHALQHPQPLPDNNGSLWVEHSSLQLFTDSKAHQVGDLVTVLVIEKASATRKIATNKQKKSSRQTNLKSAFGALNGINNAFAKNKITRTLNPKLGVNMSDASKFAGSGGTNNSDTLTASVTAVVTKIYPNGNMEITGRHQVTINQQPQALVFSGIIRPLDIQANNTVLSSKVAQATISYGGGGELAGATHQGWLARTLNQIWPF